MGLLSEGKPLSWAETKKHAELVRRVGIQQFLAIYHRLRDRKGDVLKWGDEVGYFLTGARKAFIHYVHRHIHTHTCLHMSTYTLIHEQIEYTLVTLDDKEQKARLSLLGPTILEILQQPEYSDPVNHDTKWRPEYGSYMIEGSLTSHRTRGKVW